ncbi:type II toxin-antitoxin system HipA family toxin [Vineibacter terrae]|uniref:Type II toxin-antitoxin system HipA family toxin n=1 Tax=Vineibacter terrae TaxID=2586908 RepID=A0A5C8PTE4_9HYPH|nr:type II toxin-antitoxin system HipA family toxin [Vineibacter terrae]TXL80349.1 type II toxin-antitoxin system HipA family toxin [Vineibacter terrae]
MPRQRQHVPLNIFLNSRHVGRLERGASGSIAFRYDQSWLDWEHALPVSLSLPLREERYSGAPVFAVFDNLLPDSDAIRRRIAERVGAGGVDTYHLLAAVGRDCVGALQFLPDGSEPGPAGALRAKRLGDGDIARLIANLQPAPLGLERDDEFRISIAGVQEKTALLFWKDHWHKPLGTTATTHILKPSIGRLPNGIDMSHSVENEFLCLKLAAAMGLSSAGVEMREFDGRRVLVVERFDRLWTRDKRLLRLPQEDCCQALAVAPSLKYESEGGPGIRALLDLLKGSDEPAEDRGTFLRAVIIFWLLGATDGHAKNFSLRLSPGGGFRLTPLYDVISAQPSVDAGHVRRNRMKLAMAIGDRRHYTVDTIVPRHFLQTAIRSGVGASVVQPILDDLREKAPAAIAAVIAALPGSFPEQVAASIVAGFEKRLNLIDRR